MPKLKRLLARYSWTIRPLAYLAVIAAAVFLLFAALKVVIPALKFFRPGFDSVASFRGRTNILLLGLAGGEHAGPDLTDSIMLLSIDLTSADTVLLSLPRDIWIDSLQAKLNTAYHYGEAKQPGGGLVLAKSAVSEIINQPVHYALVLDFSGFERAIDTVGGIDLDIPRGFTDKQYPIPGKEDTEPESERYETITFKSGKQHLDGTTALKYVRSRHAEGEEGTDFARSQRQQRVILAFKDKVLSPKVMFNLGKIRQLKEIFSGSVKTDLPRESYVDMAKLAIKIDQTKIRTGALDEGRESEDIPALLINPPTSLYGQWVLVPAKNNWQAVYTYVEELFYQ